MQLPRCATTVRNGRLYVKAPFVHTAYRFEPYHLVYMLLQGEEGWAYFDRSGRVLVRHVATMDNGADAPRHGTVRVTVAGKWGIATITGRPLTPLSYDGIVYAEHGYSACTGCRTVTHGEHSSFEGGSWTELDFSGKPLAAKDQR